MAVIRILELRCDSCPVVRNYENISKNMLERSVRGLTVSGGEVPTPELLVSKVGIEVAWQVVGFR